jgi:hypothetical protein
VILPEDLVEEIRRRVGDGALSAYAVETVEHRLYMEKLDEIVAEDEARHGPVSPEAIASALGCPLE